MALQQSVSEIPPPKTQDGIDSDGESTPGAGNDPPVSPVTPDSSASSAGSPAIPPATVHNHYNDDKLFSDNPHLDSKQFKSTPSSAQIEWAWRKSEGREENEVLDALMEHVGLEGIKQQFLDIKSKIDICKEQGRNLASENFSVVFQGNPGTGKTTIARLYGRFLKSLCVLKVDSWTQEEISGIEIVNGGPSKIEQKIRRMTDDDDGGVLIIDEAYQLISPQAGSVGRSAIDTIIATMEDCASQLAFVFVGYREEMEAFFEHNPGIRSRIPYTMDFDDFTEYELWKILCKTITDQFGGDMKVEGGTGGLYMRCIIRRLSAGCGGRGFGNARAVQNLIGHVMRRQARRLVQEKRDGKTPNCYRLTKEDLLGPDPSTALATSTAWCRLQGLIGLEQVKNTVKGLIGTIEINYKRELHDLRPIAFSLNQVFVGEPGTGKTTVAGLYGRILAELGFLSRGEVLLKTAADFIGDCLGKSETQTRRILEVSVGKVLIIDEAYMLDPGGSYGDHDKYKTGVLDTIVSMVQGHPFGDRCIILVGYENRINAMFRNANPGLSRRFPHHQPFRFLNFTTEQLSDILQLKLRSQDLDCSESALAAAYKMFKGGASGNHTNAGLVDKALEIAKMNYSRRILKKPFDPQDPNPELEAADFDLGLVNTTRTDIRGRMQGQIDGAIVDQLEGYQKRHLKAKELGISPEDLELIPTRFVFYGPPGTGKTTTAHAMADLFFEMGYLSISEVVEYTATDLVGAYVGHTGQRTREKLRDAIGRLVFIDASHFLLGVYETEAVRELTKFLSEPAHQRSIVVVLGGDKGGLDKLMRLPAVSSVFTEEVTFNHIPAQNCIELLGRELASHDIVDSASFTFDPESPTHLRMKRLFSDMQSSPSWGNARDVKHLARQIRGKLFELHGLHGPELDTRFSALVVQCMESRVTGQKGGYHKLACTSPQPDSSTVE